MRNTEVNQRLTQLRELINRTGDATLQNNLLGDWGRYLCVVTAGFLEKSLHAIYSDFAVQSSSSPHVAHFVFKYIQRISNPKAARFLETAGDFNPEWREELDDFFTNDMSQTKDAIDSIMNLRNRIVHGELTNVSVTPSQVCDYLERSVKVLEFIEQQCDNALQQK